MLLQIPRLTNSLRDPFDVGRAYLQRKIILQSQKYRSSANSLEESDLAKNIVYRWDEASFEVRQAYKQFAGAVVELIDGEVVSEEFREVALAVYRLFGKPAEDSNNEKICGEELKDEAWWLVLGNTSTSELYALKRVSFSDRLATHMELPSTPNTTQGMKLILVSDCYLGFEQEHSVEGLIEP